MKCPFCGNLETQVKDSRQGDDGANIRRRRFCPNCDAKFTTFERLQLKDINIIKSNGRIMPFNREKLYNSIKISVNKRNISEEIIEDIMNKILRELEMTGATSFKSEEIGNFVMKSLEKIDLVSYIRFASVYKNFSKSEDFQEFLDNVQKNIKS